MKKIDHIAIVSIDSLSNFYIETSKIDEENIEIWHKGIPKDLKTKA